MDVIYGVHLSLAGFPTSLLLGLSGEFHKYIGGPKNRPKHTMIPIEGTPQIGLQFVGNRHICTLSLRLKIAQMHKII